MHRMVADRGGIPEVKHKYKVSASNRLAVLGPLLEYCTLSDVITLVSNHTLLQLSHNIDDKRGEAWLTLDS